jgi:pyroglutamyl-peptidase
MKLLLTGFEPFAGAAVNPSEMIVRQMAGKELRGLDVATVVLPVDYVKASAAVVAAIDAHQPDVVVSLGQAARRMAVSIERVAVNLMDYPIPDNGGYQPVDQSVVGSGPAAYFVTLPVKAMLAAVKAVGVPGELSLTAGLYACNHIAYTVLHHVAVNNLPARAGFIHVPLLPEQTANHTPLTPSMSLDTMVFGVTAALEAIAAA